MKIQDSGFYNLVPATCQVLPLGPKAERQRPGTHLLVVPTGIRVLRPTILLDASDHQQRVPRGNPQAGATRCQTSSLSFISSHRLTGLEMKREDSCI